MKRKALALLLTMSTLAMTFTGCAGAAVATAGADQNPGTEVSDDSQDAGTEDAAAPAGGTTIRLVNNKAEI